MTQPAPVAPAPTASVGSDVYSQAYAKSIDFAKMTIQPAAGESDQEYQGRLSEHAAKILPTILKDLRESTQGDSTGPRVNYSG